MKDKIVVIYHRADFDGIFCREIARKFLPGAELIGWDYNDPEPVIEPEAQLYILDLSVPGLMDHPNLIWIDHHKSAMEKYAPGIPGYRIDGVAACRLAWQWFDKHHGVSPRPSGNLPLKQDFVDRMVTEPLAVTLAGEYDIWDKRDPRADLFQHGLRATELTSTIWKIILENTMPHSITVDEMLKNGKVIQRVQAEQNASIIKAYGFTVQFEGLTFLCCNHARFNSHLFTAGLTPEHDGCFGFNWTGKEWRCSLYHAPGKEHHDLSLIAVKYGGGGHRGACGFRMEKLPFLPA